MAKQSRSILDSVLGCWSRWVGRNPRTSRGVRGVVLHDPDAQKPKDLDNPFVDAAAQGRVGDLISRAHRGTEGKTKTD
jgi:hypothetical protein